MTEQYLKDISDIRQMMERSSKFISLSGISGVFAGITALLGALYAYGYLYDPAAGVFTRSLKIDNDIVVRLLVLAGLTMIIAITGAYFFTIQKAKKQSLPIWNKQAKRLLVNLAIPLFTGGIFTIILLSRGYYSVLSPSMLLFYGLALVNASPYTFGDIRKLGISEIILGLVAAVYPGFGLFFWAAGFGLLHIVYGISMYHKYER